MRRVVLLGLALLSACGSAEEEAPIVPSAPIAERLAKADPAAGEAVFRRCSACHTIGKDATDTDGPNLYGVMGAGVAQRRERFAYTAALRSVGGVWDAAKMDAWLTRPSRMVPGTKMAFAGIADPKQRADVIAYLLTQGGR